jgi:tripartite ATP-independent transporter DctP family solute receptor
MGGFRMELVHFFAGAVLVAATVLVIAPPAHAEPTILRIESNLPINHASSRAMEVFKAEVARRSGGSIQIEVSAGAPGNLKEMIDAVHVGNVFATWTGIGNFSRLVPEIAAVSLPFVYDNYDEARRAVVGPIGSLITTKLDAKGFHVLAWLDQGVLHVSNSKRPLRTLDDFKGLSIRVLPNATHLTTFQAVGARPVAMDLKDVGPAMQQGDVDGEEQDYSTTYNNMYYESQKYLSNTAHFLDFHVLVANRKAFADLDPMQQKAVREAAAIAAVQQHKMTMEDEMTALARLQEKGVQFDPLPPETRAALRRATSIVIDDVRKWVGADIVNSMLAAKRLSVSAKVPR